MELAGRGLELAETERVAELAERASEPAGRAFEPAGRASEPAGRAFEPHVWVSEPAGRVSELTGTDSLGPSGRDSESTVRTLEPDWSQGKGGWRQRERDRTEQSWYM